MNQLLSVPVRAECHEIARGATYGDSGAPTVNHRAPGDVNLETSWVDTIMGWTVIKKPGPGMHRTPDLLGERGRIQRWSRWNGGALC